MLLSDTLILFLFATAIGIYIVSNIKDALHAPLMSLTNAISSIMFFPVLILSFARIIERITVSHISIIEILLYASLILCGINIGGGFYITYKMLKIMDRASEGK